MMEYYIIIRDKKEGPYSLEKLKEKSFNKDTLIWKEGMSDWEVANNFEELKDLLIKTPPPLPQKKDVHTVILKKETKPFLSKKIKSNIALLVDKQKTIITISMLASIISFPLMFFIINNYFKYSEEIDENQLTYEYVDYSNTGGMFGSIKGATTCIWGDYYELTGISCSNISSKDDMILKVEREIKLRKEDVIEESTIQALTIGLLLFILINILYVFSMCLKWIKLNGAN